MIRSFLTELREQGKFVDVTLVQLDGMPEYSIDAHRAVLTAYSPVLKSMLSAGSDWKENSSRCVGFEEPEAVVRTLVGK